LQYPFDIAILNVAQSIRQDEILAFSIQKNFDCHKIDGSLLGKKNEKSKYFRIFNK